MDDLEELAFRLDPSFILGGEGEGSMTLYLPALGREAVGDYLELLAWCEWLLGELPPKGVGGGKA